MHTGFCSGNLREGDNLEYPRVDGWIILKLILKKWDGRMDWTNMAQDSDRWRALLTAVMNLRVPENVGSFLSS